MVLYQGMYNVAHFEINNNLQLYEDVLVGDEYDYKRLRKICFVSGSVYINKVIVNGSEIKGGAHVTIQDDSIFVNIVPENESDGIVIGITFYVNETGDMYAYTEKREGGPQGTIVESFNGRTGAVVPADTDYNAGLIGYNNETSQLVGENVQDVIDELDQEIDDLAEVKIDAPDNPTTGQAVVFRNNEWNAEDVANSFNGRTGAVLPATSDYDAEQIDYDNTDSGLAADDVKEAIDVLKGLTDDLDEDKIEKPQSANLNDVLTFDGTDWTAAPVPAPPSGVSSFNGRTGNVMPAASDYDADDIDYDNTLSQLTAETVQDAIDEVVTEVNGKQDQLTFDSTPTLGSSNPVTSDGIRQAIAAATTGVSTWNGRSGNVVPAAHDYDADQVDYDNTTSGMSATDTQAAIDELAAAVALPTVSSFNSRTGAVSPAAHDYDADQVDYDNTTSGLVASDTQAAIDEVNGKVPVITKGTTDLTPGTSPLAENAIYLYYTT